MKNSNELSTIITTLSTFQEGYLPEEELESAVQNWPQLWPLIKQSMLKFNEESSAFSDQENTFLFMGILLAVQQKEYQAYPLLLNLCDRDDEFQSALDELLGDSLTELLPSFFYILSESDTQGLEKIILSPRSGSFVKVAAAHCLFAKYENDLITRQYLVELVTLWIAHFVPLANNISEHFLAALAVCCMAYELQEFQAQFLDLANKFELASDYITPEEIEEWDTSFKGGVLLGFIRTEFNVINELRTWSSFKTPEQNAADTKAMREALAELEDFDPESLSDEYFDERFKNQSDVDILEALLADDEFGEFEDFNYPITEPFIAEPKVGRNEPCPCGSGKKYKKCCL